MGTPDWVGNGWLPASPQSARYVLPVQDGVWYVEADTFFSFHRARDGEVVRRQRLIRYNGKLLFEEEECAPAAAEPKSASTRLWRQVDMLVAFVEVMGEEKIMEVISRTSESEYREVLELLLGTLRLFGLSDDDA